jgi:hypothetical protein
MFFGAHFLLYSDDADADRAFLRDVLELKGVDIGHGWIILKLPPAEIAVHPTEGNEGAGRVGKMSEISLFFMCESLDETIGKLAGKGVTCGEVGTEHWGRWTSIPLPSGGMVGVYQPTHPTALDLSE